MAKVEPSIYDFLDYRQFLRSFYEAEKARLPAFSYRYFARKAGFSSPNFLQLVIEGQRNLGRDSVERFVKALKLAPEEAGFFRDLVAFNQAKNISEKNVYFEKVVQSRRFQAWRKLDGALLEYLRHWYYPAIRELAGRTDFVDDPAWIADRLWAKVAREEIARALSVLESLQLLVRGPDGRLSRGEPTVSTGPEARGAAKVVAAAFLRQMLERASESIDAVPPERRDIGSITVAVRQETIPELQERIRRFRRELLDRCDQDRDPTEVFQVNIQLFPLTRA